MTIAFYALLIAEALLAISSLLAKKSSSALKNMEVPFAALCVVLFGNALVGNSLLENGSSGISLWIYTFCSSLLIFIVISGFFSSVDTYLKGLK